MTATQNATIEDGLFCIREWQRGDGAHLDRWAKTYLTRKGAAHLYDSLNNRTGAFTTEDDYRRIVAESVGMGY